MSSGIRSRSTSSSTATPTPPTTTTSTSTQTPTSTPTPTPTLSNRNAAPLAVRKHPIIQRPTLSAYPFTVKKSSTTSALNLSSTSISNSIKRKSKSKSAVRLRGSATPSSTPRLRTGEEVGMEIREFPLLYSARVFGFFLVFLSFLFWTSTSGSYVSSDRPPITRLFLLLRLRLRLLRLLSLLLLLLLLHPVCCFSWSFRPPPSSTLPYIIPILSLYYITPSLTSFTLPVFSLLSLSTALLPWSSLRSLRRRRSRITRRSRGRRQSEIEIVYRKS